MIDKVKSQNYIIIKLTSDKRSILTKIANYLIKNKLVACANIINNNNSIYLWNNKIVKSKEYIMLLKTILDKEEYIYSKINEMHNYEVPEIITLKASKINTAYGNWILESISND